MGSRNFSNVLLLNSRMIDSTSEPDRLASLDPQAVTAVYNQYFPEILRYVHYRLGDEVLAEDITSEVFFTLLKAIRVRRGPDKNLRAWLIGTARHMITDHMRGKYRHPIESISETLTSNEQGPLEEVEQRDGSYALRQALAQLTEDQQQVLALRFGQGYSLEETATLMKKKSNAIKALQFRAMNALQRKLGDEA
jgi:RNA polymerase sigma-70 factor, ECF subfamily